MKYFLSNNVYNILKWIGLIACPAVAVFVGTVGAAWGWGNIEPIVITINAIGVLIGALIGISHATAKSEDDLMERERKIMLDEVYPDDTARTFSDEEIAAIYGGTDADD